MNIQDFFFFFGGGVSGGGDRVGGWKRVDVSEELKFLSKIKKKSGRVGGSGGVNEELKFL